MFVGDQRWWRAAQVLAGLEFEVAPDVKAAAVNRRDCARHCCVRPSKVRQRQTQRLAASVPAGVEFVIAPDLKAASVNGRGCARV
ncbi:hypothetical protein EMWEY_00058630, partial [Eimeria maxima]